MDEWAAKEAALAWIHEHCPYWSHGAFILCATERLSLHIPEFARTERPAIEYGPEEEETWQEIQRRWTVRVHWCPRVEEL